MNGSCVPVAQPDAGTSSGSGGQGGINITGRGGAGGTGGFNITGIAGQSGAGGTTPQRGPIKTCSCETAQGPGVDGVALLLGFFALTQLRRRPRSRGHAHSSW